MITPKNAWKNRKPEKNQPKNGNRKKSKKKFKIEK
jgi:hypothetical protein